MTNEHVMVEVIQPAVPPAQAGEGTINDDFKALVSGIISEVPEVGGVIASIIDFFWPASEQDPKAIWDSIKKYAEAFMKELLDEGLTKERMIELEERLGGIKNVLNEYQDTSIKDHSAKSEAFEGVVDAVKMNEPFFLDKRNPEKSLNYFVSFATIYLSVLRERVLFFKDIYGHEDDDKAKHLKELQDKIAEYMKAGNDARGSALTWRLDKITKTSRDVSSGPWGGTVKEWTAQDSLDVSWKLNESSHEGDITYAYNNRVNQVRAAFAAQLDFYMAPSYLWPYLNPTNAKKPVQTPVTVISGPFAGRNGSHFMDNPNGEAITKITMYSDDRFINSVEVFYGSQSGGSHHGGGGASRQELVLQDGESIVSAAGTSGDALETLVFKTNKGREMSGGGFGSIAWGAAPPKDSGAVLMAIEGIEGSSSLEGISFHWQYMREQ